MKKSRSKNHQIEPYDGLVISSGGYKGMYALGSLAIIHAEGHLRHIRKYAGCSIGAVIVTLLALGWRPIELFRRAIKIKVLNGINSVNIEGIKKDFGLLSSDLLLTELQELILVKREKIPTLLDLHNEGIYIAFSITDRRQKSGHKIDYKSDPAMPVSIAAIMSSNIPGVFKPMDFEGMKVIDGAMINPFPIDYLDNGKDKILGIALYTDTGKDDTTLTGYISGTIMIPIEEIQRRISAQASKYVDILEHLVPDLDILTSSDAYDSKLNMFFHGMNDGKLFHKALVKRARDHSHSHKHKSNNKDNNKDKNINKEINDVLYGDESKFVETPIRNIPDNIILRCLMSQQLDILCQAISNNDKDNNINDFDNNIIDRNFALLSIEKQERIKQLCRVILQGETIIEKERVPVRQESTKRETIEEDIIETQERKEIIEERPRNPSKIAKSKKVTREVVETDTKDNKEPIKTLSNPRTDTTPIGKKKPLPNKYHKVKVDRQSKKKPNNKSDKNKVNDNVNEGKRNKNKPLGDRNTNPNNPYASNDKRYDTDHIVKVKKNYSQQIYDGLPPPLKDMARSIVTSIGPVQTAKTISGINIVCEGLNLLGINLWDGAFIADNSRFEPFYSESALPDRKHKKHDPFFEDKDVKSKSGNNKTGNNKTKNKARTKASEETNDFFDHLFNRGNNSGNNSNNNSNDNPRVEILEDDELDDMNIKEKSMGQSEMRRRHAEEARQEKQKRKEAVKQYLEDAERDRMLAEERERNRVKTATDDVD